MIVFNRSLEYPVKCSFTLTSYFPCQNVAQGRNSKEILRAMKVKIFLQD